MHEFGLIITEENWLQLSSLNIHKSQFGVESHVGYFSAAKILFSKKRKTIKNVPEFHNN
jgi:hypothetical protein